jgi:hypothetical protein
MEVTISKRGLRQDPTVEGLLDLPCNIASFMVCMLKGMALATSSIALSGMVVTLGGTDVV